MGHDVSTQQQGRLLRKRAKAVVDGQYGAYVATNLSQRSNICLGTERIRRRLDEAYSGIRFGRLAPLIGTSEGNKAHFNTKFLQRIPEQPAVAPKTSREHTT